MNSLGIKYIGHQINFLMASEIEGQGIYQKSLVFWSTQISVNSLLI